MTPKFTNNATTITAADLTNSATTLQVAIGEGDLFPVLTGGDYFKATLQDVNNNYEIVKVTARSGDTMTIVRAQDGTTGLPFPTGSRFELRVLAGSVEEYVDSLNFLLL